SPEIVEEVTGKYLQTVEKNYREWLANTIRHESKDWDSNHIPESNNSGHYQTTTPVIVFQMIDQHVSAHSFHPNLIFHSFCSCSYKLPVRSVRCWLTEY